jgi:toxin-antitoxin system PIN domain toxin
VILIDANLLIYATDKSSPHHDAAFPWLKDQLEKTSRVGLPWASLLAFLRLTTNARVFARPLKLQDAWGQVEAWLAGANVWVPSPADNHRAILARMLESAGGGANLIPDAHLAALAVEHGLTLCSTDGDFARFRGLRWTNPLAGSKAL